MEAMTLERATEFMRLVDNGQISGRISEWPGLRQACGVVYAHLAQPAQAVDVGAINGVIVDLEERARNGGDAFPDEFEGWAEQITRAISGEKAGPVGDGLRFPEWVIESLGVLDAETQRLYLDPTDGNKVGLNERCAITFFKRFATDPEEACRMYGTLTASPTPDKDG